MPAPDAASLLRRNGTDADRRDRPAIRFGERTWTHGEYLAECRRWANLFLAHRPAGDRPTHVGVLADNTPDYLFALGGAALSGSTIVGLNPTRVGEHLLRDLVHTDVDLMVTEPAHLGDLDGLDLGARPVLVSRRFADASSEPIGRPGAIDLDDALAEVGGADPEVPVNADTRWLLIFTSGTSGAPKAVVCTQRRLLVTGARMVAMLEIGPDDLGYVAMPLFHSNALMVGWAPSIVAGASVGLARRFSVSGFLPDVRRYGATWFNYTGKPLSYLLSAPERPDDADNPLRIAFGNEGSPQVIAEFGRRFGLEVVDAFGSTEGAIAVNRDAPARVGAMGVAGETIRIVRVDEGEGSAEGGQPEVCPPARFDHEGRLLNADACVGEIVNIAGGGPFEGYYNNDEATGRALREGWYWSGDLGYLDEDGYLYFAGRTGEWIRVDGENFPAGPIADAVAAHPDVVVAVAYGVPDVQAGDQVMAALTLAEGAAEDPEGFAARLGPWLDAEAGIGPKWRPRYLRIARALPTTGTNKVLTRVLAREKYRHDQVGGDSLFVRPQGAETYRPFTASDEAALHDAMTAAGRERFWDL